MSDTQLTRRDVLNTAAGLGLTFALPGLDLSAAQRRGKERAKSLIVLWMAGGPSQLETWDPHPRSNVGGPTKDVPTKNPELRVADLYPQVAEQIHHLSVIRSMVSKEGDHERGTYYLKTGYRPNPIDKHPSLGAIVVHQRPDPNIEIPQHVSLGGGQWPARGGYLGDDLDAFRIFEPGRDAHNMRAAVSDQRQQRRLSSLDVVSRAFGNKRQVQTDNTLHQLTVQRALRMMASEQIKAFEIEQEPQRLRDAYGDDRFGRGCLVARRLVETGVRAIEVSLPGWDTHTDNFNGHRVQAEILDPAFATLIEDLKEHDLFDSTVVLCLGEFGREPKVNPLDGRGHWPSGFSVVLGGGGLRSGLVIGATDPTGESRDPEDPIAVQDLYATVLNVLGVEYDKELITPIGRPLALCSGTPIERLLT